MPKLQLKKIIFFKFLTIFLSILNLNNFGKTLGLYFIQKSSRSNKNWLNESYLKAKIADFPYLSGYVRVKQAMAKVDVDPTPPLFLA